MKYNGPNNFYLGNFKKSGASDASREAAEKGKWEFNKKDSRRSVSGWAASRKVGKPHRSCATAREKPARPQDRFSLAAGKELALRTVAAFPVLLACRRGRFCGTPLAQRYRLCRIRTCRRQLCGPDPPHTRAVCCLGACLGKVESEASGVAVVAQPSS